MSLCQLQNASKEVEDQEEVNVSVRQCSLHVVFFYGSSKHLIAASFCSCASRSLYKKFENPIKLYEQLKTLSIGGVHDGSVRFQNWNLSNARLNAVCPLPELHVRQPYIKTAPEVDHNICGVSSVNSKHTNFKHRQPEGWLASQWGWLNAQCGCSAAPFQTDTKVTVREECLGRVGAFGHVCVCLWKSEDEKWLILKRSAEQGQGSAHTKDLISSVRDRTLKKSFRF